MIIIIFRSSFVAGLKSQQLLLIDRLLEPEHAYTVLSLLRIAGLNTKLR